MAFIVPPGENALLPEACMVANMAQRQSTVVGRCGYMQNAMMASAEEIHEGSLTTGA